MDKAVRQQSGKSASRPFHFRNADALLHNLVENAAVPTFLIGTDGLLIYANHALCDLLGYAPDDVASLGIRQIVHPDDADRMSDQLAALAAGEIKRYTTERRYLSKNGKAIWVLASASRIVDERSGKLLSVTVQAIDIDRQKHAEMALADSESRWNFALASAGQGVWDHDLRTGQTFYSQTWRVMRGMDPTEVFDPSDELWLSHVHPDDRERLWITIRRRNAGEANVDSFEYRERHRDGHYMWILSRGRAIDWFPDGRPARFIGTDTDITSLKNAEESLKSINSFHNLVVENIPAMVFVKDAVDLRFVLINRAGEELLGIDRSEYLGKSDYDFFPKEQADFFVSRDRVVLQSGGLQVTPEEPINTRQRGRRLLRTLKMAVPDEHGQPKYLLALSEDITERRLAEIALQESEARLQFLDALGKETAKSIDAVEILATTTRMLGQHLNVAICAYADMEPDQDHFTIRGDWSAEGSPSIVGYYSLANFGKLAVKNLGAGVPLIVNDNLIELAPEEAATFQGIGIAATICMPLVKEGRLTALMAIHDRKPRIWNANDLALLSEVTERSWAHIERVRSEVSIREGERRLVQAQKMEAIGNLTGGVAHDFNNLLGIIIGNLDLLRGLPAGTATNDPKTEQLSGEALDAALRGADLTRRLLAFARRQSLQPQSVDVNQIVEGISKLLNRTIGEDIEIKLNLGADIWPVNADPSQLGASLINIVNNARDAMPKGGEVTIVTANRHLDEDYTALHPELAPGNYTLIEVSDTGTGIAPEALNHIFEPFFTTKEQGKGTGLGLSMVFGFAKQSAGHINVYSELGHGTTFRLYLPRATTAADAPEIAVVSDRGGHETILAVEDNEGLRRVVVRQLNDLGYRVLEAEDGNAASKILESEPVDLLFTDIMMPGGMSGYDLALRATSRWPVLKVLLTSGFPETKHNSHDGPVVNMQLLTKPYRKNDLALALRKVLDAG
jgi:PAS domain S-box-containing protein